MKINVLFFKAIMSLINNAIRAPGGLTFFRSLGQSGIESSASKERALGNAILYDAGKSIRSGAGVSRVSWRGQDGRAT
jgi:hypothetical protein